MIRGTDVPLPGTTAPDFTLPATPDGTASLASLRGRPVVLVFYPGDWRYGCGEQLASYQTVMPEFHELGVVVLGISTDSVWSHRALARRWGIRFNLLADHRPRGAVARQYGVYRIADKICERALFLIEPSGTVVYSHVSPPDVNPGVEPILTAVESLGCRPVAMARPSRW